MRTPVNLTSYGGITSPVQAKFRPQSDYPSGLNP
ncbi:hypothetical protein F383_35693 [Gossypium arboreum]|uniref:Uncharacterized protein n=1 Tax=Gossypium arboreum TaxID=29729 RepID=A0A0B0PRF3_GOSAR|nr:hypothetical protein F383_35693 [Gossypium arboreum]